MDISLDILNDIILSSKDYVTLKWLENIGSNISYLLSAMLLCMLVLTQQYRFGIKYTDTLMANVAYIFGL